MSYDQDIPVVLIDPYLYESDFIRVKFQNGLPPEVGINGARVEDLLDLISAKLENYQKTSLACGENEEALAALHVAKDAMARRHQRRVLQGVFNTLKPHAERTEDLEHDFSATGA